MVIKRITLKKVRTQGSRKTLLKLRSRGSKVVRRKVKQSKDDFNSAFQDLNDFSPFAF